MIFGALFRPVGFSVPRRACGQTRGARIVVGGRERCQLPLQQRLQLNGLSLSTEVRESLGVLW